MRVSRTQAEANRETVIDVARKRFREHGFDGIGLKDLMKGAGLTQGGFYKQFDSKDDLAALASQRATAGATERIFGHSFLQQNSPPKLSSVANWVSHRCRLRSKQARSTLQL